MHLHNGISHLAVAARPAMPQMSGGFGIRRQPREESQAAGMFRAAARNEGFRFVGRGRRLDRSPDLISGGSGSAEGKNKSEKPPNPRLVFSRASVIQKNKKKQKRKQASQSNLNQRGLQV